jgi:hypothetical protein
MGVCSIRGFFRANVMLVRQREAPATPQLRRAAMLETPLASKWRARARLRSCCADAAPGYGRVITARPARAGAVMQIFRLPCSAALKPGAYDRGVHEDDTRAA